MVRHARKKRPRHGHTDARRGPRHVDLPPSCKHDPSSRKDWRCKLRAAGRENFLRSRTVVSCGAILRDPDAAHDLKGVEVGSAGEEFVVRSFEARPGADMSKGSTALTCTRAELLQVDAILGARSASQRRCSCGEEDFFVLSVGAAISVMQGSFWK